MTWFDELAGNDVAPAELRAWAVDQASRADAWKQCPRPDWQLWLAAHAPDLTPRDQRIIVRQARGLEDAVSEPWYWLLSWMFPVPTKMDVVSAWGHESVPPSKSASSPRRSRKFSLGRIAISMLLGGDESTLGVEQKMKASGAAFIAALVIGIVVDRQCFSDYDEGFKRTLLQGVVCTVAWLLFIPVMRAVWRWRIKRGLDGLTFASAFEMVWPRTVRLTKRFSAEERPKQAQNFRIALRDLGKRAFDWTISS